MYTELGCNEGMKVNNINQELINFSLERKIMKENEILIS